MGVNSVFKKVQKLGNLTYTDKLYPGAHGIVHGRQFNGYYKNVKSKSASLLFSIFIGRKADVRIDANIVLSMRLKKSNVYTLHLPQKYFDFRYLSNELRDRNMWQLMYRIINSKDFQHFVKLSIDTVL